MSLIDVSAGSVGRFGHNGKLIGVGSVIVGLNIGSDPIDLKLLRGLTPQVLEAT